MYTKFKITKKVAIIAICLFTGLTFTVFKAIFSNKQSNLPEMEPEPIKVVTRYHQAMARRDGREDLGIYSKDTIKMLNTWTVTAEEMDNAASETTRCHVDKSVISGDLAVVRYKANERQCTPYFLVKEYGTWKLNLAMKPKAIRFDDRNQWHFDMDNPSAMQSYKFAFIDWNLDKYGYPHSSQQK